MNIRTVAIGAAVVALVAAGCGGSSDTGSTSTTQQPKTTSQHRQTLTHEELIARMDRICRRGNAAAAPFLKRAGAAADAGDYDRAADITVEGTKAAYRYGDPTKLAAPPEDADAFGRYVKANRRLDLVRDRVVTALRAGDTDQLRRLGDVADQARTQRTQAARDLGTRSCGS